MSKSPETPTMTSLIQSQLTPGSASLQHSMPKYGTVIPGRIFVGGIPPSSTETELKLFFSPYGQIKDCKIISDRSSMNKGSYGFVTFESNDDSDGILNREKIEDFIFKDRKLNIGPAIRKQAATTPPSQLRVGDPISSGVLYSNGIPYTYQNGMAVFHSPDGFSSIPHTPPTTPYAQAMMNMNHPGHMFLPGNYPGYPQSPVTPSHSSNWSHNSSPNPWSQWSPQTPVTPGLGSSMLYPIPQELLYNSMNHQQSLFHPPDASSTSSPSTLNPPPPSSVTSDTHSPDSECGISLESNGLLSQSYSENTQRYQAEISQQIAHLQQLQQYHMQQLQPAIGQPQSAYTQMYPPISVSTKSSVCCSGASSLPVSFCARPSSIAKTTLLSNAYKRTHQYSTPVSGLPTTAPCPFTSCVASQLNATSRTGKRILAAPNISVISDPNPDTTDDGPLAKIARSSICIDINSN